MTAPRRARRRTVSAAQRDVRLHAGQRAPAVRGLGALPVARARRRVSVPARPRAREAADRAGRSAWWLDASVERATGRSPWRRARRGDAAANRSRTSCTRISARSAARWWRSPGRWALPLVTSLYGVDAAVLPYLPQWRDQYARLFREGELFLAEGPEMRKKIIAAGAPAGPDRHSADRARPGRSTRAGRPTARRRCCSPGASSRRRDCSMRSPPSHRAREPGAGRADDDRRRRPRRGGCARADRPTRRCRTSSSSSARSRTPT